MAAKTKSLSPCSDQWYVFGLVSFSDKFCGHYQNSNTAFISTIKHRKWILQVSTIFIYSSFSNLLSFTCFLTFFTSLLKHVYFQTFKP